MDSLGERLSMALGYLDISKDEFNDTIAYGPDGEWYKFDPLNDSDLFKRCLIELMNEDPYLETLYADYLIDGRSNSPVRAIYTAYCEMKESQ